jgi:type IV pilus modification protein PilV
MNTFPMNASQRGFSMIEVMISIVVLGFGLLALAALQTSVIRSSAETKAQTIALQLAKDKIEDLRAFQTLEDYRDNIASSTANEAIGDVSGVNFTRSWVVTRWAYNPSSTNADKFESVTPLTGETPTGGTTPSTYVADNEYKRVAVTVTWTDANGVSQSVRLDDAIGALSPADGSKVVLNNSNTSQARKPQVLIYDPGATGGVIPIAVGNGSSTAASNPTPVIKGQNNDVAETLFEVLTYAGTSGNVLAQSRVETAVVACTCSTANAPAATTARGYRPTYWNGYRYAPPVQTTDKPTAGWSNSNDKKTGESDRCEACCRDHRDPAGVTGAKFDPWRTTHDHYLLTGSTLTLANTGTYTEACRLIRVDGFFRVAADLRNDYFGLLETNNNKDLDNNDQNQRAYAPRVDIVDGVPTLNDAKTNYQNFVLKYMDDRFSNNTAYTYNTALATGGYESTYNLNNPVDNNSAPIAISLKVGAEEKDDDSKWSHVRGLYVDYIEPEALDVIKQARINCTNKTTQLLRNTCVLPYVPFTSVNLTELADWQSKLTATIAAALDKTVIQAANNSFYDDPNLDSNVPTRGNVFAGTTATVNSTAYAVPLITQSNSGVALKLPIDTDEATLLFDSQQYIISNSSGGGGNTGGAISFFVSLFGTSAGAPYPQVGSNLNSNTCTAGVLNSYIPYVCGLAPDANNNMQLKLTGYSKASSVSVVNGCDTLLAGGGKPNTNANVSMPIILDYGVASAVNSTSGSAGIISTPTSNASTSDSTVLTFASVAANDTLAITFTGPVRYCPSNYSPTIVNKAKTSDDDPYGNNSCTTGGTPVPKWSTTLVTCPIGTPGI